MKQRIHIRRTRAESQANAHTEHFIEQDSIHSPQSRGGQSSFAAPPFQLTSYQPIQRYTKEEEAKHSAIKGELLKLAATDAYNHMSKFVQLYMKSHTIPDLLTKLGLSLDGKATELAAKILPQIFTDFINEDSYSSYHLFGEEKKGKKLASEYYGDHDYHDLAYVGNWANTEKSDTMRPGWGISGEREKDEDKWEFMKRMDEKFKGIDDYDTARKDEKRQKGAVRRFKSILKERRGNSGAHSLITKDQYELDEKIIEGFLTDSKNIKKVDGVELFVDAAKKYEDMQKQAASDGITLKIIHGHRDFKDKSSSNSNARAKFSVHHLRNAIDLKLNSAKKSYGKETSTTTMNKVRDKRDSPVHKWMVVHGKSYGWYPFTPEPWHWEYNPPGFRMKFKAKLTEYILQNADAKLKIGEKAAESLPDIFEGKKNKKKGTEKLLIQQLTPILEELGKSEDATVKEKMAKLKDEATTEEEKLTILKELLGTLTAEAEAETKEDTNTPEVIEEETHAHDH